MATHIYSGFLIQIRVNERNKTHVQGRLEDGEEGEEEGQHGDGGETGHPAQGVLHTGGGQGLVPGQGQYSS